MGIPLCIALFIFIIVSLLWRDITTGCRLCYILRKIGRCNISRVINDARSRAARNILNKISKGDPNE